MTTVTNLMATLQIYSNSGVTKTKDSLNREQMEIKTLQAINLSCVRQYKTLFSDFSFSVSSGELLLIEGENGAGKSSLLRLLASLATPITGDVTWQGESIYQSQTDYRSELHYVGHANGLKLGLTVAENLKLINYLSSATIKNTDSILQSLQLFKEKNKQASHLSAGQKRRLALAKLFLFPKQIWIVDEPLTALDLASQEFFLHALTSHLKQGGIAVISSHHAISLSTIKMHTLRLTAC